jgi:hypothetical protein
MAWDNRYVGKADREGKGGKTGIGGGKIDKGLATDTRWLDAYDHSKGRTTNPDAKDAKDAKDNKSTTGAGFTVKPACNHTGLTPWKTLSNGLTIYPAKGYQLTDQRHLDVILDLAGLVKASGQFVQATGHNAKRYNALNRIVQPDIVRINWQDMTAPVHVRIDFWVRLGNMLAGQHVGIACMGGHGRTGTCMAALMIAVDGCSGKDAIEAVRTLHCARAIETKAQEDYLIRLADDRAALTVSRNR